MNFKNFTRIIVIVAMFTFSFQGLNAQIKISPTGKVGFKTINPEWGTIEINKDGKHDGLCIYEPFKKGSTFRMFRYNNYGYLTRGGDYDRGIRIAVNGQTEVFNNSTYAGAIVFGLNAKHENVTAINVRVDDSFKYRVMGDGRVYAKSFNVMSDETLKENINGLDDALSNVMKLNGVSYNLKREKAKKIESTSEESEIREPESLDNGNKYDAALEKQTTEDANKKQLGLLAQEVEMVYPELVTIGLNGKKSVNYIGLIPVLIEALKNQQQQLVDQQKQLIEQEEDFTELRNSIAKNNTTGITSVETSGALLKQNRPNPFNEQTTIEFFLPETVSKAVLNIFDLTGKQVKSFDIVQRNEGEVKVFANELQPGMYSYALIADGKIVDTRSMIITE